MELIKYFYIFSSYILFAFSLYILYLNSESEQNKVLFIFSLLVSFIVFANYQTIISSSEKNAFFWFKLTFFWPLTVSFTLHFILTFVKVKYKGAIIVLNHILALILSIYQISFMNQAFNLVLTSNGWSYYLKSTAISKYYIFTIYAVINETIAIIILIKQILSSTHKETKIIKLMFILTILINLVYGAIFGILSSSKKINTLKDFNSLIIVFDVLIYGYLIMKFGVFKNVLKQKILENLNYSNTIILIVQNGKINYISNYFSKLLCKSNKELLEKSIETIFNKHIYKELYHILENLEDKENKKNVEIKITSPNGRAHYLIFNIIKIYNPLEDYSGYIFIGMDVTHFKIVQQNLRIMSKQAKISNLAKANFIHNVNHELRTPLNAIIGFSSLLYAELKNEEQKKEVEIINNSAKILLEYFENLIDISDLDFFNIVYSNFNLTKLIKSIYRTYKYIADENNIKFFLKLSSNLPETVRSDSVKIKQIIIQLLNNSFKFVSSNNPEVKLIVEKQSEDDENYYISFLIKDNGIGIEKDKINQALSMFEQLEEYITKKHRGIGLGLYIVKQLIEVMNGEIEIKSEKNIGTEVFVVLPVKKIKE